MLSHGLLMKTRLYAKKKWGQHFLIRPDVVEEIVRTSGGQAGETVWEIGPGEGVLTAMLLEAGCRVVASEVDPRACSLLRARFGHRSELILHEGDVMEWSDADIVDRVPSGARVVANLPYNIATPLLGRLFQHRQRWQSLTLMVQLEVAERLCATPQDGKAYGPLSLLGALGFQATLAFRVPPSAFRPPPKVDSAVLHLIPRESGLEPAEEAAFLNWSRRLFQSRRKTLWNNIQSAFPEWRQQPGLQERVGQQRPENLTFENWLELFKEYRCFQNTPSSSSPSASSAP